MVSSYLKKAGIGEFANETVAVFRRNIVPLSIYAIIVTAISSALTLGPDALDSEAVKLPCTFLMGYVATWVIMRNEALTTTRLSAAGFIASSGAGILIATGVAIGLVLLIVPGLLLLARASIATSLIVARGVPVIQAFSDSARMTKPFQWTLVGFYVLLAVAFVVLVSAFVGISLAAGFVDSEWFDSDSTGSTITGCLLGGLMCAGAVCLNTALFAVVLNHAEGYEEIFA